MQAIYRYFYPEFIKKSNKKRAQKLVDRIYPYLQNSRRIIDIGSGTGYITSLLKEKGKTIQAVDIANNSFVKDLHVTIYNGEKLPFKDNSFDTSLLITVLHHTDNPEKVLMEAIRVSKEIIVIETGYANLFGKIAIVFIDTLANLTIKINWSSFRTDNQWKELFKKLNLKIVSSSKDFDMQMGIKYSHPLYFLSKNY